MINYYKTVGSVTQQIPQMEPGCWINVCAPDLEERNWLINSLDIPPEFLQASLDEEESSHIEAEDGQTLIIIDVPFAEMQDDGIAYYTIPIGIIVCPKNIVTVSIKDNSVIREFADGVIKGVNTTLRTRFFLQILLRMATRFLQHLKQIDKRSTHLERQLRKSMRNKELIQLLDLQKSLVYFQTSLKSNEITLEKITKNRAIALYEEDQELLEDVMIEIKQAIEMSNIYLSILSGTMDAFASVISNNLNIVMKVLTSITIVMAIPTMIFSFYGMNIGEAAGSLPFASNIIVPIVIAVIGTLIAAIFLLSKGMFK
ncbi:MAG: magnesium transporter CorA family protein [Oscillospiraceae bacterium]